MQICLLVYSSWEYNYFQPMLYCTHQEVDRQLRFMMRIYLILLHHLKPVPSPGIGKLLYGSRLKSVQALRTILTVDYVLVLFWLLAKLFIYKVILSHNANIYWNSGWQSYCVHIFSCCIYISSYCIDSNYSCLHKMQSLFSQQFSTFLDFTVEISWVRWCWRATPSRLKFGPHNCV